MLSVPALALGASYSIPVAVYAETGDLTSDFKELEASMTAPDGYLRLIPGASRVIGTRSQKAPVPGDYWYEVIGVACRLADEVALASDPTLFTRRAPSLLVGGAGGSAPLALVAADTGANTYPQGPDAPGFDIVLGIGQSNMAGVIVEDPITVVNSDPRLQMMPVDGPHANTAILANDPMRPSDWTALTPKAVGPLLAFGRTLLPNIGAKRKVLLVNAAMSATSFADGTWIVPTGNGYTGAVAALNAAMNLKPDGNEVNRIVGALWIQGESDAQATPPTGRQAYLHYLETLITALRTNVSGASQMPFVILGMRPSYFQAVTAEIPIDAAQQDIPSRNVFTSYVPGVQDVYNGDVHYQPAQSRQFGVNGYQGLLNAYANNPAALGQVTGLSQSGATHANAVNLAWNTVSGAGDYTVQFKPSSGSTWSTFDHIPTKIGNVTVTGLTSSTPYDFRVAAMNGGGQGTYSSTLTVSTGAPTASGPLLDVITAPAKNAHSTRKLRASYAGPALQVTTDYQAPTQDIGFDADGNLDEAALLAFVGTGQGYVTKLYDQSGNAQDLPYSGINLSILVQNGVINRINGKPALRLVG